MGFVIWTCPELSKMDTCPSVGLGNILKFYIFGLKLVSKCAYPRVSSVGHEYSMQNEDLSILMSECRVSDTGTRNKTKSWGNRGVTELMGLRYGCYFSCLLFASVTYIGGIYELRRNLLQKVQWFIELIATMFGELAALLGFAGEKSPGCRTLH